MTRVRTGQASSMTRRLRNRVVVITGASSGIGRATALTFAGKGATVVVAARRAGPLEELARECEQAGGRALAVPTDVTDEQAVDALARSAVDNFGRVDVWVNNAGVYLLGRVEDVPMVDFRRVLDVNLVGQVHGARAALRCFRDQGGGVLVNVGSMLSKVPAPYGTAYVASKHGVRALSDTLRTELAGEKGISVCTVMPAAIDTPLFRHAANYTGRAPKPPRPVYPPEKVARIIVACAQRPQREVFAGSAGRVATLSHALLPKRTERVTARAMEREQFFDDPEPDTIGNLYSPADDPPDVGGGHGGRTRSTVRTVVLAALLGSVALIVVRGRAEG